MNPQQPVRRGRRGGLGRTSKEAMTTVRGQTVLNVMGDRMGSVQRWIRLGQEGGGDEGGVMKGAPSN